MLDCTDKKKNIGVSTCKKAPSFIKNAITTPNDYSMTAEEAADPTNWQTAIKQGVTQRIYLWPGAVNYENVSEEQVLEETPITAMDVRPGNYRFRLMFRENLELHKAMYSHRNTDGRVFFVDIENKIIGTSPDNGATFKGLLLDNVLTEKFMINTGTETTKTPVGFYCADNRDLDVNGAMIEAPWINSLIALTDVNLTLVGTPSATTIVVDVTSALDKSPIEALVQGDFVLLDGTGAAQTISGVVEGPEGRYTISGTAFVAGTLDLVAASALSIDAFESTGPLTITI